MAAKNSCTGSGTAAPPQPSTLDHSSHSFGLTHTNTSDPNLPDVLADSVAQLLEDESVHQPELQTQQRTDGLPAPQPLVALARHCERHVEHHLQRVRALADGLHHAVVDLGPTDSPSEWERVGRIRSG